VTVGLGPLAVRAVDLVDLHRLVRADVAPVADERSDRRGQILQRPDGVVDVRWPGELAVLGKPPQAVQRPVQDPRELERQAVLEL
jgi:hypothetical protein